MTREDWPVLAATLRGIWPKQELSSGAFYLRLLAAYPLERIDRAIDRLAASQQYAPKPAELLQGVLAIGGGVPDHAQRIVAWLQRNHPEYVSDGHAAAPAVNAVNRLQWKYHVPELSAQHDAEFTALAAQLQARLEIGD